MPHAPHSFRAINVFIQHTRYEVVFVLRWELVAMCSGAQKITGVLWFGEQLPQNMTRVGRDGPDVAFGGTEKFSEIYNIYIIFHLCSNQLSYDEYTDHMYSQWKMRK